MVQIGNPGEHVLTATEHANVRLVLEHFAAESKHDHAATLATLADAIEYRNISNASVLRGKEEVSRYYDAWWTASPRPRTSVRTWVFRPRESA